MDNFKGFKIALKKEKVPKKKVEDNQKPKDQTEVKKQLPRRIQYSDLPIPKKSKSEINAIITHKYPTRRKRNKKRRVLKKKKNEELVEKGYDANVHIKKNSGINGKNKSVSFKFNNWIKSVLISKYCSKNDDVLDLGCGRGGDLGKYHSVGINSWTGVDISSESVDEARKRFNNKNNFIFEASFIVADLTSTDFQKEIQIRNIQKPIIKKEYDLVSQQFSIHYFFKNQQTLDSILNNISKNLKPGGHFICTTIDGYVIKKKLMAVKENVIENGMYKLEFEKKNHSAQNGFLGIKYVFTLINAVNALPEYLVHPKFFREYAKKFGLEIVEEMNFHDFIERNKEIKEYKDVFDKFYSVPYITKQDWDTVYIYRVYVFKKVGKREQPLNKKKVTNHTIYVPNDMINLMKKDDDVVMK